jgi:hypothetical protein
MSFFGVWQPLLPEDSPLYIYNPEPSEDPGLNELPLVLALQSPQVSVLSCVPRIRLGIAALGDSEPRCTSIADMASVSHTLHIISPLAERKRTISFTLLVVVLH